MKSIKIDNHKELGHRFWSISDTNQLITYRCLSIFIDFDRVSELSICYILFVIIYAAPCNSRHYNESWQVVCLIEFGVEEYVPPQAAQANVESCA